MAQTQMISLAHLCNLHFLYGWGIKQIFRNKQQDGDRRRGNLTAFSHLSSFFPCQMLYSLPGNPSKFASPDATLQQAAWNHSYPPPHHSHWTGRANTGWREHFILIYFRGGGGKKERKRKERNRLFLGKKGKYKSWIEICKYWHPSCALCC